MKYEYLVFDMDGTLVDSGDAIVASLSLMQEENNLEILSKTTLKEFLGPPLKDSFMKYYHLPYEATEDLTTKYRDCYMRVGIDKTVIFDNVISFLEDVKKAGCKTAIATLKQHQLASKMLELTKIDQHVDYIALNLNNSLGDKSAQIKECLNAIGCTDYSKAVFFGDSNNDYEASKKAGVDFIYVKCSEKSKVTKLEDSNYVYESESFADIEKYLLG